MTVKSGKVWGQTEAILQTPVVEFHRIIVKKGYRCSTHKHLHKWNGFFVEEGELEIHVMKSDYDLTDITTLKAGEFGTVKPGEFHYFVCRKDAIAFEIYYPELLSEDIERQNVGGAVSKNSVHLIREDRGGIAS